MDPLNKSNGLVLSDKFGVSFLAGWMSAFVVSICTMFIFGWSWSALPLMLLVLVFSASVFMACFFFEIIIFQYLFDHLIRKKMILVLYVVCGVSSTVIAIGLTQLLQNPSENMEFIGAIGGLTGGLKIARTWTVVHKLRQSFPARMESNGKILFFPNWVSGAK